MGVIKGSKRGPYNKSGIKVEKVSKKIVRGKYKKSGIKKISDEEIIEIISRYKSRKEIKMSSDARYYFMAIRRDLREYLPPKLTNHGNIVGSALELKLLRQKEKELLQEPKVKKKPGRKPKEKENIDIKSLIMFPMINIDGKNFCGRCHIVDLAVDCSGNKNLCSLCYSRKNYLISQGKYTNLFNVKDEYVNTIIKHHEKVFEIGLKVDDKTQDYLSMIGYQFIFKENS